MSGFGGSIVPNCVVGHHSGIGTIIIFVFVSGSSNKKYRLMPPAHWYWVYGYYADWW
jgi:hypothetical protein